MRIGSLFSGIGGLELGLEWSGLGHTVWQCETNPFCLSVLARQWPNATRYPDVKTLTNPPPVDLICGGFPCQDVSSAGKGAGLAGSRSGLWFEFARIVDEARPEWVVVENVASGARRWVDAVCSGLGQLGYETLPIPLSAADVGAPHLRKRIFVVAHAIGEPGRRAYGEGPVLSGLVGEDGDAGHAHGQVARENRGAVPCDGACHAHGQGQSTEPVHGQVAGVCRLASDSPAWTAPPEFRRMDDGIPRRVDRLRALGNAVVPQCAEVIGYFIQELL